MVPYSPGPIGGGGIIVPSNRMIFTAYTDDTIVISTDYDNPSVLTGLTLGTMQNRGVSVHPTLGAVRNDTGRDLTSCTGQLAIQPNVTQSPDIRVWSQLSTDGVAWTANATSQRDVEIGTAGEAFKTLLSLIDTWPNGYYLRFVFAEEGTGSGQLEQPGQIVSNGETVDGHAAVWHFAEDI